MLRIILDKDNNFVEIENSKGQSIRIGTWSKEVETNKEGQEFLFNVITISAEALRGLLAKEEKRE